MAFDLESWKEFMAQQQAQFWADLQAMEARQAETARLSEENRQNLARLVEVCLSLANHAEETDRRLGQLGEETDGRLKETDRLIRELRDAQAHSDQRLDALISVVDKLVHRNGKHE